jgi:hypothetical protein
MLPKIVAFPRTLVYFIIYNKNVTSLFSPKKQLGVVNVSTTDKPQAIITKYGNTPDTFDPTLGQMGSNINSNLQESRLTYSINPWDGGVDE